MKVRKVWNKKNVEYVRGLREGRKSTEMIRRRKRVEGKNETEGGFREGNERKVE